MYEDKQPWYFNFVRRDIAALLPPLRSGDRDHWQDRFTLGLLSPLFVEQHLLRGTRQAEA